MKFKQYLNEVKQVKTGVNKAGTQYRIVQSVRNPEQYVVHKLSQNYKLGKIMKSWVFITPKKMDFQTGQKYAKEGIPYEEALALFDKRLKGKAK
jgi:hypothetical protein